MIKSYHAAIFLVFLFPAALTAQIDNAQQEIGIYEHLDEYIPEDAVFLNKDRDTVKLKYLVDKPTVLSFVYFNCPGLCSPLLDGIAEVMDRTDLELGEDYQVVTISFNEDDTPELGQDKKKNYVKQINRDLNTDDHWIWLTGDSINIQKITKAAGFRFQREGDDFVHAAAIIVLSPNGKITRYLHGTYFLPFDLKMAIVEAQEGISGPTINKVLKFCFSYDAEGKKYVFNITKISGTIILSLALIFLLVLIFRKKKSA